MAKRKDILTTGQVAQICHVAPRTVTKWFDSGQLKGYRIPGSRDRRIPASELIRFMKVHDLPIDTLEAGKVRILLIDSDWEMASMSQKAIETIDNYEVHAAHSSFEAGIVAQKFCPQIIIINLMSNEVNAYQVCRAIHASEDLQGTKVIACAENITAEQSHALMQKGFDATINDPVDIGQIERVIDEAMAIIY